MQMVDAAEKGAAIRGSSPPAWVTREAAVILRKLKDKPGEIAILERYISHCETGVVDQKLAERLERLR